MKSLKKMKIGAVVMAAAMLVSSVSAFACANDKFIAYDQIPDDAGLYGKIYKCPEKDELIRETVAAKDVEWKHAFYEAEYPHREIMQLWLEGNATGLTLFEGNYADVNVKELPDFWEAKIPYIVYNRVYSDFTGAFERTNVLKTNLKTAPVEREWVKKGFDKYVVEDGVVKDYSHVYGLYDEKVDFTWHTIANLAEAYWNEVYKNNTSWEAFKAGKLDGAYALFDNAINRVSWLELAGPDYVTGGVNKFQPFEKIVAGSPAEWYDDLLVSDNKLTLPDYNDAVYAHLQLAGSAAEYQTKNTANTEWVTVGYELAAPYRYIQVLSVDGVLMDGSEVEIVGYEVEKEEVVDIFGEMPNRIQVIEKAKEQTGYDWSMSYDYVLTPFTSEVAKNIDETVSYKVVEDYLREQKLWETCEDLENILADDDATRELRFVKVTKQPGKTNLPYIWRYAGGCADPKVEWKTAFAEAAKPYEIYEEKFVDDIATGVYRPTGRYAEDIPSVSTVMGQPRILTVMLADTTNVSNLKQELINAGYDFIIAGDRLNVVVPAELYDGYYGVKTIEDEIDRIINNKTEVIE